MNNVFSSYWCSLYTCLNVHKKQREIQRFFEDIINIFVFEYKFLVLHLFYYNNFLWLIYAFLGFNLTKTEL